MRQYGLHVLHTGGVQGGPHSAVQSCRGGHRFGGILRVLTRVYSQITSTTSSNATVTKQITSPSRTRSEYRLKALIARAC